MTNVKRRRVAKRIHDAKEHGDLTENAEYEDAKNEQAFVEGRIQTLEALIKNATIIDENHSTDHVQIGSTVKVESPTASETFTIVGSAEAKPGRGPDLQREPRRPRAARQQEGREGHRQGPRRRLHLQDRQHQLSPDRWQPRARLGLGARWRRACGPGRAGWTGPTSWRRGSAGPQVVNDSKTPSGTVHVGSLRGPVILDAIARALRANGIETTFLYGVDDLDPMDAQALLTPDAVEHEMGRPLAHVPDQAGDGHASYARHHAQRLHRHVRRASASTRTLLLDERASTPTGADGPVHPDRARPGRRRPRDLPRGSANVQHPDDWQPVSVDLPELRQGRHDDRRPTGTASRSSYECRPDARRPGRSGCGSRGWVSPFGGDAKLPWNLEWAAQWRLFGVTIEPCGKDLATAGGSRDRSDAIAREVFEREPPLNVPYEFLNIGGKKMSTSKGRGAAAHAIAEVVPPEQLRFLFLRQRPNHAIEFDPDGTDAIPRLFDEFDRLAAATAGREVKGELPPGYEATFRYSLLDPEADVAAEAAAFRPAFAHLALLIQIPGVDVAARVAAEKGSAADRARARRSSSERVAAARAWLDDLAPERRRLDGPARRCRPPAVAELDRSAARASWRACRERATRGAARSGDAWQDADLRRRRPSGASRPAGRSRRSTSRSWAGRTARGPAGCSPASIRRSSRSAWRARRGRPAGGVGMSVGLQRLRDDAGRDPRRAPSTRARTRRSSIARSSSTPSAGALLGEGDGAQGGAQRRLEADR